MILDFKEIPIANSGSGEQDTFELFARDFLQAIGYKIIQHPDRGADGKKDLIVQESRIGLSGSTNVKWLVSCKHYAHTGKSVSDTDEPNILDRVATHQCDGFLGFYSTLPATSLGRILDSLKSRIETQHFDKEQIESKLLESPSGVKLASRYFSSSYEKYRIENPKPAKIFSEEVSINCEYCGKNLLTDKSGIVVLLQGISDIDNDDFEIGPYTKGYFSCKGNCDRILKNKYLHSGRYADSWCDISDYLSPTGYVMKQMAWLNAICVEGERIEGEALEKLKHLFLNSFPHISREQTSEEKERIRQGLEFGFGDIF